MNKIIIKMRGGLGNQLFMLAYAIKLSKENDYVVYIDDSDYKKYKIRNFELDNYLMNNEKIHYCNDSSDRFGKTFFTLNYNLYRALSFLSRKSNWKLDISKFTNFFFKLGYIFSQQGRFDDTSLKKNKYYVFGYFQNYEIIDNVKTEILNILHNKTVEKNILSNRKVEMYASLIKSKKRNLAVSIRCGEDYVSLNWPICSKEYYLKSISYLMKKNTYSDEGIIVFADDVNKAKKILKDCIYKVTFIEGTSPVESLYLLTLCDDYIISNSSFSWWGQEASYNQLDKTVIAPEYWFNTHDLYGDVKIYRDSFMIFSNNGNKLR